MTHPDDATLLRALHEPGWVTPPLADHLAACQACQARQRVFAADDAMVETHLRALDHAAPALSVDDVAARVPGSWRRRAVLVAQLTLFCAAAAAAMAIPASPLHRLLWGHRSAPVVTAATPAAAPAPPQEEGPAPVGIALTAPAELVVELRHPQVTGVLDVRLVDGNQVTVRSRGGTVGYSINEGHVLVDNRVAAEEFLVEMPSALARAEVRVGNRILFQKRGDQTTPAAVADSSHFRIVLADSGRAHP